MMAGLLLTAAAPAKKFYDDDPLEREPKPRDASNAARRKISDYYDFFQQSFASPGERNLRGKTIPAQAVNTLGEPMDGAWWTRRHYYRPMSIEELVRGARSGPPPSMTGKWRVVKAKSEGVTPGLEFIDSNERRYVLKFDPLEYPEIATGPDVLVSKFFHALGYWVPDNYIVHFTRDQLELAKDVRLVDAKGRDRLMTGRDLTELLIKVPKSEDGLYRGGASLYLSGKPIGPYKYFGTRSDDPNDIVLHEHRRDLRGLSVFCAWLAHDDSRSINSLDMIIQEGGISSIRHHLIDFGSTLGSASYGPNSPRSGFEYLFESRLAAKQFFTFGLAVPGWAKAKYPHDRAVGRFESKRFDALGWVPEYPNPAFSNRLPEDGFWAAKQVMAFTDEQIRAIVATGEYSRKASGDWISNALIERRDKIGRGFFAQVLPLDKFAVAGGKLVFEDLEVKHKFRGSRAVQQAWFSFDNETEQRKALPQSDGIPADAVPVGGYLACDLTSGDTADRGKKITVYLRRLTAGTKIVGLERIRSDAQ
jgi:hypothetical protein